MKKINHIMLSSLCMIGLAACNSGGGNNQNNNVNNSVQQSQATQNLLSSKTNAAGFTPGLGIINYSVATDYYYGMQNKAPSLKADMQSHQQTKLKYVFPDMGSLDVDNTTGNPVFTDITSSNTTCQMQDSKGKTLVPAVINYMAQPQLKEYLFSINQETSPLGPCVGGESVNQYYHSIGLTSIPLFEYTSNFTTALASSSVGTVQIQQLAKSIAQIINNDPYAYGMAIDNESAISSVATPAKELTFFATLAQQLNTQGKYLFVFDANTTMKHIYNNGDPTDNIPPQTNVVAMDPLYDQEAVPQNQPFGPVPLDQYTNDTHNEVTNYFKPTNQNPPVMFVAPASSTNTVWDSVEQYNFSIPGQVESNPTQATTTATCDVSGTTMAGDAIDYNTLSDILGTTALSSFLSQSNCIAYKNVTPMDSFVQAATNEIKANAVSQPKYYGVAMYAWRIHAFNDIACSSHYINQTLAESDLEKVCNQTFPANIPDNSWSDYSALSNTVSTKQ